jgi:hypothetical protein
VGTLSPVGSVATRKALIVSDTANEAVLELWGNSNGKSVLQTVASSVYMGSLAGTGSTFICYASSSTGITIANNGYVGLGTTNPQVNTHCAGTVIIGSGLWVDYNTTSKDTGGIQLYSGDGTSPRISYYYFDVENNSGTGLRIVKSGSPDSQIAYINSSSGWNAGCSIKLKQDVVQLSDDGYKDLTEQFNNIPLYSYKRKGLAGDPEIGFIAEETPDIAGSTGKAITYIKTIGFLTTVVKNRENIIENQETRIRQNELRIEHIEQKIKSLKLKL